MREPGVGWIQGAPIFQGEEDRKASERLAWWGLTEAGWRCPGSPPARCREPCPPSPGRPRRCPGGDSPQPGAESPAHPHQVGLGGAQGRQPPARCREPCPPSPDRPRMFLPPLPSTPELARSCVLSLWLGSSPRLDHPALLRTSDPVMLLEQRGSVSEAGDRTRGVVLCYCCLSLPLPKTPRLPSGAGVKPCGTWPQR